jgi:hypothetical protein
LYCRTLGKKSEDKKPVTDKEFHAAIKMLIQFLLIIQDMSNCGEKTEEDEKNRKNSQILKAYVFRHELWKVVFFAFNLFNPARHALEVLQDTIYLNHLLI